MRRFFLSACFSIIFITPSALAQAPTFVNGLVFPGDMLDATGDPGVNGGRVGFFSDIYYDPVRNQWWAISDRGPGGGLLPYATRVQRFTLDVHPVTGRISNFKIKETIKFTDPKGLLAAPSNSNADPEALNGLNPLDLNGNAGFLGRSFDPEGLVIDQRGGRLIVADEYGPSIYVLSRNGTLLKGSEPPDHLIPKVNGGLNFVADRDTCDAADPDPTLHPPFCGLNAGRQDNRGFEGLAITPDGNKVLAVLQDPLVNEPGPNNGRNGRTLRDRKSTRLN